jgi:hypothetical protein
MLFAVAPPKGNTPARATVIAGSTKTPLDPQYWAARLVADGWEVEVKLPWPGTGNAPSAAGATVGFQLGLGMSEQQDKRIEFATLPIPTVAAGTTCPQNHAMPWCDDRTWCKPTAQ